MVAIRQNGINANQNTPLPSLQGGSGVSSPTVHGILIGEGAAAFNSIVLTNGQFLIGSTGLDPVAATLTAGTGISITNTAGSVTIASAPSIVDQTSAGPVTMVSNTTYFSDAGASLVTFLLPNQSTVVKGDVIKIRGQGAGLWILTQSTGQQIQYGNLPTTSGTGGSIASTLQYDCLTLEALTPGTTSMWLVTGPVGEHFVT